MCLMLYFLRHGQTAYSKTGGYCGTPENDPGLTAEGIEMAEEFADVYRSLPWRAAYVSPLQRAIQTAKPLCEAVGLKVRLFRSLTAIS